MSIVAEQQQRGVAVAPLARLVCSPKEAMALMGIGRTYLYQLIKLKEIETYVDGRARKIWLPSVYERMERLREEAAAK
jgi:excisionase family DNA binding protein